MKFGIMLNHQYPKDDDLAMRLDEVVRIAETARDLGYESLFRFAHEILPRFVEVPA